MSFAGSTVRTRHVKLAATIAAAATSFTLVSSAHGWKVGDAVLFLNTTNASTVQQTEERIISAIAGAVITISSAVTYAHLSGSPVGNLTCNVVIRSFNEVSGQMASNNRHSIPGALTTSATAGYNFVYSNVRIQSFGAAGVNFGFINGTGNPIGATNFGVSYTGCVFSPDNNRCFDIQRGGGTLR